MKRPFFSAALMAASTAGLGAPALAHIPKMAEESSPEVEAPFAETAQAIASTIRSYHYNPAELDGAPYRAIEQQILTLGQTATSEDEFLDGFRQIWRDGPFSHVNLNRAQSSVDQMVSYLDNLQAGPEAVQLTWEGDTAILAVNTMMGSDTISAIEQAYDEVAEREATVLIIDLRANEGGAFAIRPLIGHVLSEPFDAGVFVAQKWNAENSAPPNAEQARQAVPWNGWSVRAFWDDAQAEPFIRVQIDALTPAFTGPVYVLTSSRTASAAELATDALQASGRATVIGEQTAGEMLSQRPYDIQGKYHLFLPIADYFSLTSGRIEGVGVTPDIAVSADQALAKALAQSAE